MDYHLHWGDLESVIQLISFAGLSAMINAAASQTIVDIVKGELVNFG